VPKNWKHGSGIFSQDVIKERIYDNKFDTKNANNQLIMVCGPPRFMEAISGDSFMVNGKKEQGPLKGVLADMGLKPEHVFKF
jgi:cytochrome-b5 reductase